MNEKAKALLAKAKAQAWEARVPSPERGATTQALALLLGAETEEDWTSEDPEDWAHTRLMLRTQQKDSW